MPDAAATIPETTSSGFAGWQSNLRCPDCGREFASETAWECRSCGFRSPSPRDLRPIRPQVRSHPFDLTQLKNPERELEGITVGPPKIVYDGPCPGRSPQLVFSALAAHCGRGSRLLDLGCGPRDQAEPAAHMSYEYLGIDYSNAKADLLADAHALPFAGGSFDAVLSFAVFEHLHNPFLAIREVSRILKPGGVFVGVVSQGEPFHESYFHHTAWGVIALAASTGELDVAQMWPSRDTLLALARMSRYSKVVKLSLRMLDVFNRNTPF
ncbi:MAG: methyltransferase domain-containing protein, partial [Planctomycetaceae bacterium]|nr:methyltransferase domain-containing protein [Planctomycetaceae bacterium]